MIIRANNFEPRNASEYFILDRQYDAGEAGRFDLTGICWPRSGRRRGQVVPLALMEVKFALNPDIQEIDQQLARYYQSVASHAQEMAEEAEGVLQQKLELGLFKQPADRLEAMKTLTVSRDVKQFHFIIVLIDYNPHSSAFKPEKITMLPFANQVKIFYCGFAMWQAFLTSPDQAYAKGK